MLIWWGVIPLLCKNSSDVIYFVTDAYAHGVSIHYQFARVSVRLMIYILIYISIYIYTYIQKLEWTSDWPWGAIPIWGTRFISCAKRPLRVRQIYNLFAISGFRREADENYALMGCYAASSGNSLPTFRYNLSVPSSRVKKNDSWPLKMVLLAFEDGTNRFSWNVGRNYHYALRNNPKERSSHKNHLLKTYCSYMFRLKLGYSLTAQH